MDEKREGIFTRIDKEIRYFFFYLSFYLKKNIIFFSLGLSALIALLFICPLSFSLYSVLILLIVISYFGSAIPYYLSRKKVSILGSFLNIFISLIISLFLLLILFLLEIKFIPDYSLSLLEWVLLEEAIFLTTLIIYFLVYSKLYSNTFGAIVQDKSSLKQKIKPAFVFYLILSIIFISLTSYWAYVLVNSKQNFISNNFNELQYIRDSEFINFISLSPYSNVTNETFNQIMDAKSELNKSAISISKIAILQKDKNMFWQVYKLYSKTSSDYIRAHDNFTLKYLQYIWLKRLSNYESFEYSFLITNASTFYDGTSNISEHVYKMQNEKFVLEQLLIESLSVRKAALDKLANTILPNKFVSELELIQRKNVIPGYIIEPQLDWYGLMLMRLFIKSDMFMSVGGYLRYSQYEKANLDQMMKLNQSLQNVNESDFDRAIRLFSYEMMLRDYLKLGAQINIPAEVNNFTVAKYLTQ